MPPGGILKGEFPNNLEGSKYPFASRGNSKSPCVKCRVDYAISRLDPYL